MKRKQAGGKAPIVSTDGLFEDMGFSPAEALEQKIKAEIYLELMKVIRARAYTQGELAKQLGIHQPDASFLMNGRVSKFSVSRLIHFAAKLNLDASIKVSRGKAVGLRKISASAENKRSASTA